MSQHSERRRGTLKAVETGDGERVECDGIHDLLDQFCTSVKEGRTPHPAILVHLAGAFEEVLCGRASTDEALGLKHDRSGRHKRYRGRRPVPNRDKARAAFWRDRRLAASVRKLVGDGHKLTEAYDIAAKEESKESDKAVTALAARRAWKAHGEEVYQWIRHLTPAAQLMTHDKTMRVYNKLLKVLPPLEQQVAQSDQARHQLALQAARLCGSVYGRAVGMRQAPLVEELLWDRKQMLGPRQFLAIYLNRDLMTEGEAQEEWRQGYCEGAVKPGTKRPQGSPTKAAPRRK